MGNEICGSCTPMSPKNSELRNENLDTDSSYNIWDTNPIRSLNSFQSQMTFSANLNGNIAGYQKNQYQSQSSPKNSTTINTFTEKTRQSQMNQKFEALQDHMKNQNYVIDEETEVDTIVDIPKESMRNLRGSDGQKAGFSNFKDAIQIESDNNNNYNTDSFEQHINNNFDDHERDDLKILSFQENMQEQEQSKEQSQKQDMPEDSQRNKQQSTIKTIKENEICENNSGYGGGGKTDNNIDIQSNIPSYSLKYIQYDNNLINYQQNQSTQCFDQTHNNNNKPKTLSNIQQQQQQQQQ